MQVKKVQNKKGQFGIIFLLLGVFSTMPIVCVKSLSVFNIIFLFATVCLVMMFIASGCKISFSFIGKTYFRWLTLCVISGLIGGMLFQNLNAEAWSSTAYSSIPKLLLYLFFSLMIFNVPLKKNYGEQILKGIFLGCVINCIWSVVDGIGYYILGISINNVLFSSYAIANKIHYNEISLCVGGLIRASGFNYDPAHMGLICPIVVLIGLKRHNSFLTIIGFLSVLTSASTTALVTTIIVLIINYRKVLGVNVVSINKKKLLMSFIIIMIFIIGIIQYWEYILSVIRMINNRIKMSYLNNLNENLRTQYIIYFPKAVLNSGIFSFLGSGIGTASYWYVTDQTILNKIGFGNYFPYDMEMTYIAYFLDTGIIGFMFLVITIKRLLKIIKDKLNYEIIFCGYAILICQLVSGLFYHYIINSIQVLAILCLIIVSDNINRGYYYEE